MQNNLHADLAMSDLDRALLRIERGGRFVLSLASGRYGVEREIKVGPLAGSFTADSMTKNTAKALTRRGLVAATTI